MQFPLNYPLSISFKIIALAPQISITDANGKIVAYVKQKLFKLKESVTVFEDQAQTRPQFTLNADRIIDISAMYHFSTADGLPMGSVKRQGLRSFWRAHYDISDSNNMALMTIREEDAWVKVLDALFSSIPLLGSFSGYVFHPAYIVARPDNITVMRLQKQPAFFEGKFELEKQGEMSEAEEQTVLLSLIMMLLLERTRG